MYGLGNARGGNQNLTFELLLGDLGRNGVIQNFDAGTYFGGEAPQEDGLEQWSLFGSMAENKDLWTLFHHHLTADRAPHLVWMPEVPAQTVVMEVRFPKEVLARIPVNSSKLQGGFASGEMARMISNRHGLAFYTVGFPALWYISRGKLAAAGASHTDGRK